MGPQGNQHEGLWFRQQVKLFYLYRMLSRFYLYLPIFVVFLLKKDFSYFDIGVIIACYGLAVMALKPFVRLIAKYISPLKMIFCGEFCKALGILGLALSQENMVLMVCSQVFIGFGFSLTAGTDSVMLYKWAEISKETDEYRNIETKSQGQIFLTVLVAGIMGAVLAGFFITLPFLVTVPFNIAAAIVVLFMQDVKGSQKPNSKKGQEAKDQGSNQGSLLEGLHVILFYAINRAIIMTYFVLALPLLLFVKTEITISFFGLILSLFSLTAFVVGKLINIQSPKGWKMVLWGMVPFSLIVCSLLLTLSSTLSFIIVPIFLGFAAGIVRPLAYGYINHMMGEMRESAIFMAEFLFALLNVVFLILIASLFLWNIHFAFYTIISILLLFSIYQFIHYFTLRKKVLKAGAVNSTTDM